MHLTAHVLLLAVQHDTGLTWTPKFSASKPEHGQALQEHAATTQPTISEGDVVLRDLFNGFTQEQQVQSSGTHASQTPS